MEPTLTNVWEQVEQAVEEARYIHEQELYEQERLHRMVKEAAQDATRAQRMREEVRLTREWLKNLDT